MLLTLAGLAVLSVASAFWLRIVGFAVMMLAVLLMLGFAFWNEFESFALFAAYGFAALLVMQGSYFAGVLLRSAFPLASRPLAQKGDPKRRIGPIGN